MLKPLSCTLIVVIVGAGACERRQVNRDEERPAPPDRLVVTTKAGTRFTGPAARIDIRHRRAAKPPDVEVAFSASGIAGRTWAMQAMAPSEFLRTLTLTAQVVDRPLEAGHASLQVTFPDVDDASLASSGLLQLRLERARLVGEVSGASDEFAAVFEGPFVVTCAIPTLSIAPGPSSEQTQPALVIDERFESAPCKGHAALAGWSR